MAGSMTTMTRRCKQASSRLKYWREGQSSQRSNSSILSKKLITRQARSESWMQCSKHLARKRRTLIIRPSESLECMLAVDSSGPENHSEAHVARGRLYSGRKVFRNLTKKQTLGTSSVRFANSTSFSRQSWRKTNLHSSSWSQEISSTHLTKVFHSQVPIREHFIRSNSLTLTSKISRERRLASRTFDFSSNWDSRKPWSMWSCRTRLKNLRR